VASATDADAPRLDWAAIDVVPIRHIALICGVAAAL
jgi:hypothetical protein